VKFGINIPQVFPNSRVDVGELLAFLKRADELECHSLWVLEQPMGMTPSIEPTALLAFAAAATKNVRLATAVVLLPLRTPVALAKVLASIDQLSEGRLIVGVGLGGQTHEYAAFGLSPERKVHRFEEAVTLLKRLWTESTVTFDGEFWQLQDIAVHPKPLQYPRPPLWFGGGSPRALQRVVRLGDGFIGAGSASTEQFGEHVQLLRGHLSDAGRELDEFPICKRVYIALNDDPERARRRMREWFGQFYKNPDLAEKVAVFGDAQRCIDGLIQVGDAGAQLVVLHPVFDELAQMELLWRDVVPEVRASTRH
jgi:probable F420-dependent oxidoreductase